MNNPDQVTEEYSSTWAAVEWFASPDCCGMDDYDSLDDRIQESDEIDEHTKALLRFPPISRHYDNPRLDEYFRTGLETFSDVEKKYISIQTDVYLAADEESEEGEEEPEEPDEQTEEEENAEEEQEVEAVMDGQDPEPEEPEENEEPEESEEPEEDKEKALEELAAQLKEEDLHYYRQIAHLEYRKVTRHL